MKVSFLFTNIYENRKKIKDIITYVAYVPEKKNQFYDTKLCQQNALRLVIT